jgi:hypothetical protein
LLKSMYAAQELSFQLLYDIVGAATCWHIWLLYSRAQESYGTSPGKLVPAPDN